MSLKWAFPIAGVLGILIMICYVTSANTTPPLAVPITTPVSVPFVKYIGGAGITEPNTEIISLGTNKSGLIKSVDVRVGQIVQRGQILFVIENLEAQAQRDEYQAEFHDAQDKYNIIAAIKDKRAVSQDERNQKTNALEIARAKLKAAEANLELHNIRSPIDGVILSLNTRVGEYAQTGNSAEPFARLGNISPMYIRIDIDENDAWRFRPDSSAVAYVRGNNNIKVDLQFVRIEPYVRPKTSLTGDSIERVDTRVLQLIYKFEPTGKPIYIGQQMDAYIEDNIR